MRDRRPPRRRSAGHDRARTSSPASPPKNSTGIAHDHIVDVQKAIPANVGYKGFPKTLCTSVNHVVCHGIPNPDKSAQGRRHRQHRRHRDQGWLARRHQPDVLRRRALGAGQAPGAQSPRGDAAAASSRCVRARRWATSVMRSSSTPRRSGFSVVREYCGHGIGQHLSRRSAGAALRPARASACELEKGMTFTVEPMINAGKPHTRLLARWLDRGHAATIRCRRSGSTPSP